MGFVVGFIVGGIVVAVIGTVLWVANMEIGFDCDLTSGGKW